MAQGPDRWAAKILGLPVFSDRFVQALLKSPYANLTLVLSMEVGSAAEFVLKIGDWSSVLDPEVREDLLTQPFMLEQYWLLVHSIEKQFLASRATQFGFGFCDAPVPAISADVAKARRVEAIKALTERRDQHPKKAHKTAHNGSKSNTPLLDQENAERLKWAKRLEEIGQEAGSFSKLLIDAENDSGLSADEISRLRQLVLSSGAPRTMAVHIGNWDRFVNFLKSNDVPVFPVDHNKLIRYAMYLDLHECGPSVIPTFRTSIKWVTSKLAIECPDVNHQALLAVQADVINRRAKALKEAVPIPPPVVRCLELFVVDEGEPDAARLFIWWWLCMIFASLRFDDAIHVKPNELTMTDDGMFGVAWQTKVERRRRGAKFVVAHVGFSGVDWLRTGWDLLQQEDMDRDFWIRDLNTREQFCDDCVASYTRSLQWFRFWSRHSINHYHEGEHEEFKSLCSIVPKFTAHSARETMLDAAVHAGRSAEEIGLQANLKNPGPLVLKYTRNRSAIPAQMMRQLVQDMLVQIHPVESSDKVDLADEDPAALDQVQYFTKKSSRESAAYDLRYHCSAAEDSEAIACGRLNIEECNNVGNFLPDYQFLCKHCARARPELLDRSKRWGCLALRTWGFLKIGFVHSPVFRFLGSRVRATGNHGGSHCLRCRSRAGAPFEAGLWTTEDQWSFVQARSRHWLVDGQPFCHAGRWHRISQTDAHKTWSLIIASSVRMPLLRSWPSHALLPCGRLALPCRIISPTGVPRWKRILPKFLKFQAPIMLSSGKSLWVDIQMFYSPTSGASPQIRGACSAWFLGSWLCSLLRGGWDPRPRWADSSEEWAQQDSRWSLEGGHSRPVRCS